jgi:hypothetical protein
MLAKAPTPDVAGRQFIAKIGGEAAFAITIMVLLYA